MSFKMKNKQYNAYLFNLQEMRDEDEGAPEFPEEDDVDDRDVDEDGGEIPPMDADRDVDEDGDEIPPDFKDM